MPTKTTSLSMSAPAFGLVGLDRRVRVRGRSLPVPRRLGRLLQATPQRHVVLDDAAQQRLLLLLFVLRTPAAFVLEGRAEVEGLVGVFEERPFGRLRRGGPFRLCDGRNRVRRGRRGDAVDAAVGRRRR